MIFIGFLLRIKIELPILSIENVLFHISGHFTHMYLVPLGSDKRGSTVN